MYKYFLPYYNFINELAVNPDIFDMESLEHLRRDPYEKDPEYKDVIAITTTIENFVDKLSNKTVSVPKVKNFFEDLVVQISSLTYKTRMYILAFFMTAITLVSHHQITSKLIELASKDLFPGIEYKKPEPTNRSFYTYRPDTFDYTDPKKLFIYTIKKQTASDEEILKTLSIANDTLDLINNTLPKAGYKTLQDFKDLKKKIESNGKYYIYNDLGYCGFYQLGYKERYSTGYGHVTFERFKADPTIWPAEDQEIAYNRLLSLTKGSLTKQYHYIGKVVGGIFITEGCLIGGAGLGVGNVRTFLESNGKNDPRDASNVELDSITGKLVPYKGGKKGVPVSFIMKKFQYYDVSGIKPASYKQRLEWAALSEKKIKLQNKIDSAKAVQPLQNDTIVKESFIV